MSAPQELFATKSSLRHCHGTIYALIEVCPYAHRQIHTIIFLSDIFNFVTIAMISTSYLSLFLIQFRHIKVVETCVLSIKQSPNANLDTKFWCKIGCRVLMQIYNWFFLPILLNFMGKVPSTVSKFNKYANAAFKICFHFRSSKNNKWKLIKLA